MVPGSAFLLLALFLAPPAAGEDGAAPPPLLVPGSVEIEPLAAARAARAACVRALLEHHLPRWRQEGGRFVPASWLERWMRRWLETNLEHLPNVSGPYSESYTTTAGPAYRHAYRLVLHGRNEDRFLASARARVAAARRLWCERLVLIGLFGACVGFVAWRFERATEGFATRRIFVLSLAVFAAGAWLMLPA